MSSASPAASLLPTASVSAIHDRLRPPRQDVRLGRSSGSPGDRGGEPGSLVRGEAADRDALAVDLHLDVFHLSFILAGFDLVTCQAGAFRGIGRGRPMALRTSGAQ